MPACTWKWIRKKIRFCATRSSTTWSAAACTLVGAAVSAPLLLTELLIDLAQQYLPQAAEVLPMVVGPLHTLAPLHYGLLIGGAVVFVITIIWRIIFHCVNKKRPEAA